MKCQTQRRTANGLPDDSHQDNRRDGHHSGQLLLRIISACAVLLVAALTSTSASATGDDAALRFQQSVRPIFEKRCLTCHNSTEAKGDFSLQTKAEMLDSGYVIPGDVEGSRLVAVIATGEDGTAASMPKQSDALSADEVSAIRRWVSEGAQWPDGLRLSEPVVSDFDWWSLQPLRQPAVPKLQAADREWARNPIDAFIAARHQQHGLAHAEEADRRTLIRRVTFDLTGLPPTPGDISAFLGNPAPDAYEQLVDRLLASPAYGERWARHWLDVVKYADTCGYDKDKLRNNAWPYRDYVIRSFNDDKPYAQFVQEQLAGDVLFPGKPDGILGLGFIAAGPWDFIGHVEVPESKIDGMVARNLDRDDMVTNTLNTFCSVTIQCARCHNHKFDPFTQEHYYSLQSVFAAVDRAERPYDTDPETERLRHELTSQRDELNRKRKALDAEIEQDAGPELAELKQQIQTLAADADPAEKQPEFGYHSQIAAKPDTDKWVEVDLGRQVTFNRIVLHPCHDDFGGIGAGFGFPVRFRITTDSSAADRNASEAVRTAETIADYSDADFPNPGLASVSVEIAPQSARYIRIAVSRLAERKNDFILALAELEVLDDQGSNVALKATVNAADSIEAPERWRKANLVDGIWANAQDPTAAARLLDARQQQARIMATVNTPERQQRRIDLTAQQADTEQRLQRLPTGKMVYAAATHFSAQGNFQPTQGKLRTIRILHRGNETQPGAVVDPGAIPLHPSDHWKLDLAADSPESDRRAALAHWITRTDNPLTWRSVVNRIWQYHFGRGIVDSPNDFGRMGQLPSHPELLDWLATEFRDGGQSFKSLHRLIVNSATYRQVSTENAVGQQIDSGNRLLWRANRRRLEAEEVRDAILAASGKLNPQMYGPGFYLFVLEKAEHSPHYEYYLFDPADPKSHRRSVYRFIVRSQPDPFMATLDCADSSQSTPRRTETLTSLQALSLLNNRFNLTMSGYFAERLKSESTSLSEQVKSAFFLVTGRQPNASEQVELQQYAEAYGLPSLCRVLLNLSEFVFVD